MVRSRSTPRKKTTLARASESCKAVTRNTYTQLHQKPMKKWALSCFQKQQNKTRCRCLFRPPAAMEIITRCSALWEKHQVKTTNMNQAQQHPRARCRLSLSTLWRIRVRKTGAAPQVRQFTCLSSAMLQLRQPIYRCSPTIITQTSRSNWLQTHLPQRPRFSSKWATISLQRATCENSYRLKRPCRRSNRLC